jgi:hypothetical protein
MSDAWDKAVEAGWFAYEQLPDWDLDQAGMATILRAAFPILAEKLVAWHDVQADALEGAIEQVVLNGGHVDNTRRAQAHLHRKSAHELRARIQQMAEAL